MRGVLGAGGVGEVVASRDNDIERVVAIKRLKADMRSPSHLVRFIEEIKTIGALEHPNIVPIHDVGVDENGDYFFVMKYVEGETLEHVISKLRAGDRLYHERYGFERRVEIFMGILEAVQFAHEKGVLHRDLKPSNVMIGPNGEVLVMDWGLARRLRANESPESAPSSDDAGGGDGFATRAGAIMGTPAYMSPEQARGETLDARSDVYALSVLFHELLGLEHYLHAMPTASAMLVGVQVEKAKAVSFVASAHQPPAPMDLSHFIRKGLAKEKDARYQSVQEMIDRLRRRAEGYIPIECHVTFVKRVTTAWSHFVDRHPFIVTGLLVVFALWTVASLTWMGVHLTRG
jgi:serine/threonine-protein kinase